MWVNKQYVTYYYETDVDCFGKKYYELTIHLINKNQPIYQQFETKSQRDKFIKECIK